MLFPENGSGGGGGGNASEEVAEVVVAEPVVERENFDIKLVLVDPKSKIKIIKEVRAITGLGLKEVKTKTAITIRRSQIFLSEKSCAANYFYDIICFTFPSLSGKGFSREGTSSNKRRREEGRYRGN